MPYTSFWGVAFGILVGDPSLLYFTLVLSLAKLLSPDYTRIKSVRI